jgi:antitoxin component YwqK of YwqJK toxin-antitoxin module
MEIEMKRGKKHGKMIKRFFFFITEMTAFYKNDLLDGVETYYYKTGQPRSETHYKNGLKHGSITSWHPDGMIEISGTFVNDMRDGAWINYDERGLPISEGTFKEGTGKLTFYDPLGRVYRETNFVNNKKEGQETHYLLSGEIEKTLLFKEDRIIEINGVPVDNL